MVQLLWNFLIRLNIYLPYDQETTSPNIHPRETKRYVLKKTCIRIFIATWFIVVPNLKQHKNLSIVEWERKLQYYDGKKKECYTYKSNNTDECQKHYIQQKKADTRVAFRLYEDSRIVKTNLWWQESERWLSVVEYN